MKLHELNLGHNNLKTLDSDLFADVAGPLVVHLDSNQWNVSSLCWILESTDSFVHGIDSFQHRMYQFQ